MGRVEGWAIFLVLLVAVGAGGVAVVAKYNDAVETAASLDNRLDALETSYTAYKERVDASDKALARLDTDVAHIRSEARAATTTIERARREDPEVAAVDRPWPASVRVRVFVDPDPTNGSTARAGVGKAGGRGEPVPVTR